MGLRPDPAHVDQGHASQLCVCCLVTKTPTLQANLQQRNAGCNALPPVFTPSHLHAVAAGRDQRALVKPTSAHQEPKGSEKATPRWEARAVYEQHRGWQFIRCVSLQSNSLGVGCC